MVSSGGQCSSAAAHRVTHRSKYDKWCGPKMSPVYCYKPLYYHFIFIERYKNQQIHYPRCRQRSVHWTLNLVSRYCCSSSSSLWRAIKLLACSRVPPRHVRSILYVSANHRFPFFEVLKILTKSFTDIHWLISTSGDPMCSIWRCAKYYKPSSRQPA